MNEFDCLLIPSWDFKKNFILVPGGGILAHSGAEVLGVIWEHSGAEVTGVILIDSRAELEVASVVSIQCQIKEL